MPQTRSGKTYVATRPATKTKVKTKVKVKAKVLRAAATTTTASKAPNAINERSIRQEQDLDLPLVALNPTRAQLKRLFKLEMSLPGIIQREIQKYKDKKALPRKLLFKIFISVCLIMGIAAIANTPSILEYIQGLFIRLAVNIPGYIGTVLRGAAEYGSAIGDVIGRQCTKTMLMSPMRLDMLLKRSLIENYGRPNVGNQALQQALRTGHTNSYTFPMLKN